MVPSALKVGCLALLAGTTLAIEGEVYCHGGAEVIERWVLPSGGLSWSYHGGPGGMGGGPVIQNLPVRIGPQFYPLGAFLPQPQDQRPGLQSLIRATRAWSEATIQGQSVTSVAFASPEGISQLPITPGIDLISLLFNSSGRILDERNLITLWEPQNTFAWLGGSGVVAVALVSLSSGSTGVIAEADIALNASSSLPNGRPFWSFVEFNEASGLWYGSTTLDVTTVTDIHPISGYVDLEGVVTHELGHLLGLTHSVVDGLWAPTVGTSPSMFITGHTTSPFSTTLSFFNGLSGDIQLPIDAAGTPLGGLLAATAKSLELDDKVSIGTLYPSTTPVASLGRIQGRISRGDNTGVRGAIVVAIKSDAPDVMRVGTFSKLDGQYSIGLLPPGDYYVLVERLNVGSGGLFNQNDFSYFAGSSACTVPPNFTTEYFDAAESLVEPNPMAATSVTVNAGQSTTGVNIVVDNFPESRLKVKLGNTAGSERGVRVAPAPNVNPEVTFQLDFGFDPQARPAWLLLSPLRTNVIIDGQLLSPDPTPGISILQALTIPANSSITVPFSIPDSLAHRTLFAQVAAFSWSTFSLQLSNPVAIYIERP